MDTSDSEEDGVSLQGSSSDEGQKLPVTPSRKRKQLLPNNDDHVGPIIVRSAFDAYFTQNSARPQTSANVFSSIIPPLSAEEYTDAMKQASDKKMQSILLTDGGVRNKLFSRILRELGEGYNVLCYGFGSKRSLLNQFALERASKIGHVVVVNGFHPSFTLKDLFSSLEAIPEYEPPVSATSMDAQAQALVDHFSKPSQKRHLYMIIHNIDSPALRTSKAKAYLQTLVSCSRIHIAASVDHLNAPLIWSSRDRFSWLWHDTTSLEPYDAELASSDRSSISGSAINARRQRGDGLSAAGNLSESAVAHTMASVTPKSKQLFKIMAEKQLEAIEEAGTASANDMQPYGIPYNLLFQMTKEKLIATNDTSLRQLLTEFRDHSLIVSAQGTSGNEVLWIPLRKERLKNVLEAMADS